jgi:hypothetical protein
MVLENPNLGAFFLRDNSGPYLGPLYGWPADLDAVSIGDQQHFIQLKLLPCLGGQAFDDDRIPHLGPVLSGTRFHNCVHDLSSLMQR